MPHRPKVRGKRTAKWYASFTDARGRSCRVPAFSDKGATAALEHQLRRISEFRRHRRPFDAELQAWLDERCPDHVRVALAKSGLVNEARAAAGQSLTSHVEAFRKHLELCGDTARHVRETTTRIEVALAGSGFLTASDLAPGPVRRFMAGLVEQGRSPGTLNAYAGAVKHFGRWLETEEVLGVNPFRNLERSEAVTDTDKGVLTVEQAEKLLASVKRSPRRLCKLSGPERSLLYRMAMLTGLRRGELEKLERRALDFGGTPPTVTVFRVYAKARRERRHPLRADLAELLGAHVAEMLPSARVFGMARNPKLHVAIRRDLEDAGLPLEDERGGKIVFHSLRHSYATWLKDAEVNAFVGQAALGHSRIEMTARYTAVRIRDVARAVDALPLSSGTAG